MCQIEPFVLPCCSHVYINVKRTPSCPAEWPRKKCPADLCIQVRAFEPAYRPVGRCWRCKGKDEGLTKKETEDKYTPFIDEAEVVMGLEEVTAKERRAHAEHWGNCWFCHSSGDCQHCGARKIRSYTPSSSPRPTMAVNTPDQEVTTPGGAPRARVPKRERPESMYDVKKRTAKKLKEENGGVTPISKRTRRNTRGATPTRKRAITNPRRRSMNGPVPANLASTASTAISYGSSNIGTLTAPGNFYQPSALGQFSPNSEAHPMLAPLANTSPSLSTYNKSPYATRNSGPTPPKNFQEYGNTGSGNAPLAMGYPALPYSVYSNPLTPKPGPSPSKPAFKSSLRPVASHPAMNLSLDPNLGARSSAGDMDVRFPVVSKLLNTARHASSYGQQPVQQSGHHDGLPAISNIHQPRIPLMQQPVTPQSNTQVSPCRPQQLSEISSMLSDYNLRSPPNSSKSNIESMDFINEDINFDECMTDLYGAPDAGGNQYFDPTAPYAPPCGINDQEGGGH